jgi:hypothetical protein
MNHSTFDNNMIKQALQDMSPEDLDRYQKMGGNLYKTIDFAKNQVLNNVNPPMEEKLSYIDTGLKSGLSPLDLQETEIELLIETYGDDWYKKYGYSEKEIGELAQEVLGQVQQYRKCGRNQKCPCNSGKKFKVCHGKDGKSYKPKPKLAKEISDAMTQVNMSE